MLSLILQLDLTVSKISSLTLYLASNESFMIYVCIYQIFR